MRIRTPRISISDNPSRHTSYISSAYRNIQTAGPPSKEHTVKKFLVCMDGQVQQLLADHAKDAAERAASFSKEMLNDLKILVIPQETSDPKPVIYAVSKDELGEVKAWRYNGHV